jgi:hypothetical protein
MIERLGAPTARTYALVEDRVHWIFRPQTEPLPGVVLLVVSEDRPQLLDGEDDMKTARVQASAFSKKYAEARQVAEAIIKDLRDEADVGDILFYNADTEGPRDLGEETESGFVHQVVVDLIMRYAKAA